MSLAPRTEAVPVASWQRELGLTLLVAGIVVLFSAALLLWDPGFFWIDDSQSAAMPEFCDLARAWRAGEFPLLSPYSWRAGALGCEYAAGVFSPTLAACILVVFGLALPLALGAGVISTVHLAVLAAGTVRLARRQGLSAELAILVALVASLNGWIVLWGARGWGVCLYSFAWLPWAWWGLEFARSTERGCLRFVPAGIFLFLVITAGWPLTVLMAALLTIWLALRIVLSDRQVWSVWPLAAAWLVGLGLAAPAWLMLLEYLPQTVRGQTDPWLCDNAWMVPWTSLPALIFPGTVSVWNVFNTWKFHQAAELSGGLVPIVMLLVCLKGHWRSFLWERRWEWGLLAVAFLLATGPALGNFRWSFRWLPLFFLVLALVAAHAVEAWRTRAGNEGRMPNLGLWALLLLFAVWLRAVVVHVDPTPMTVHLGIALLAICFFWQQCETRLRPDAVWRAWLPSGVVFLSCFLTYACNEHFCEVPRWSFDESVRQPAPLDPQVRYFSVYTEFDMIAWNPCSLTHRATGIGAGLFLGNTSMYSGVELVNGYSPFGPRGLDDLFDFRYHGHMQRAAAERVLAAETGPNGLLALFGVDGLIVADRFAEYRPLLNEQIWHEVAKVEGGTVFHRAGPPSPRIRAIPAAETVCRTDAVQRLRDRTPGTAVPLLLIDDHAKAAGPCHFAPAQVTLVEEGRCRTVAKVQSGSSTGDVLVVFTRPWLPGYEARCNGRPVPVEQLNLVLPAVRVPAGADTQVVLEYRPRGFVVGMRAASATAFLVTVALVVTAIHRVVRRRRVHGYEELPRSPRSIVPAQEGAARV